MTATRLIILSVVLLSLSICCSGGGLPSKPELFSSETGKDSSCKGERCLFREAQATETCNPGYGLYEGKCKKCDCGDEKTSCTFTRTQFSLGKRCSCPGGYGDKQGKCTACDCGGAQHSCTFTGFWNTKACVCAESYEVKGKKCEKSNPCAPNPCRNGAKCSAKGSHYECFCDEYHTGKNCENDFDPCAGKPCQNGGTCVRKGKYYNCTCDDLHTGKNCEYDFHPCAGNPCQNGATCVRRGKYYNCTCDDLHTGKNCEYENNPCATKPCQNGGTCVKKGKYYNCTCDDMHSGKNCEEEYHPCTTKPCQNGGTCVKRGKYYNCKCDDSHFGKNCEKEVKIDYCDPNPCMNGGTCERKLRSHRCVCPPKYSGSKCEIDSTEPEFSLTIEKTSVRETSKIKVNFANNQAILESVSSNSSSLFQYFKRKGDDLKNLIMKLFV